MNLKDIVCDFEYAVKLKELGVKQESLFYVLQNELITDKVKKEVEIVGNCKLDCFSVFTSDELLEMLPNFIEQSGDRYWFVIQKDSEGFTISYADSSFNEWISYNEDPKLSNSLAKMLIWLIENKYVNTEDLCGY